MSYLRDGAEFELRVQLCTDDWVDAFVHHVMRKGIVPGTTETERGAQSTT